MKFKNLSLTLLATVAFGAGISSDISAAAVATPVATSVAAPVTSDAAQEVTSAGALDSASVPLSSLDKRLVRAGKNLVRAGVDSGADSAAAADAKFDAASATVAQLRELAAEKSALEKAATDALIEAVSVASNMQGNLMTAKAEKKLAETNLKTSPAFLLTQNLTEADKARYIELLKKGPQLAQAIKTLSDTTIKKMTESFQKASTGIDAIKAERSQKNEALLALTDSTYEYTENPADTLTAELEAKQATIAALTAKQVELTAAVGTLETIISKAKDAIAKLTAAVKAGKGDPANATKLVSAKKDLAKNEALFKTKQSELDVTQAQIPNLQINVEALQAKLAEATANPVPADEDHAGTMARLMMDIRSLGTKIAKMEKLIDPEGPLSKAKQKAEADLADLQKQAADNQTALDSFESDIIARSAASPAPLRRTASAPAMLPPPGSAVSPAPVEGVQPALAGATEGSAIPPSPVASDLAVAGSSDVSTAPLTRAASSPDLSSRAAKAEAAHIARVGSGRTLAAN